MKRLCPVLFGALLLISARPGLADDAPCLTGYHLESALSTALSLPIEATLTGRCQEGHFPEAAWAVALRVENGESCYAQLLLVVPGEPPTLVAQSATRECTSNDLYLPGLSVVDMNADGVDELFWTRSQSSPARCQTTLDLMSRDGDVINSVEAWTTESQDCTPTPSPAGYACRMVFALAAQADGTQLLVNAGRSTPSPPPDLPLDEQCPPGQQAWRLQDGALRDASVPADGGETTPGLWIGCGIREGVSPKSSACPCRWSVQPQRLAPNKGRCTSAYRG